MKENLLQKVKDNKELEKNIHEAIKAYQAEDVEKYTSLLDTLQSQLENYSKKEIFDIMSYFMVQEGYATNKDIDLFKILFKNNLF